MRRAFRLPPFKVDRSLHIGLAVQLADALRTAIHTGYYTPGDVLPPIRDMSAMTGVSSVLVSRAIRILKDERLVCPRPHAGIEVCAESHPMWRGQVMILVPSGGSIQYLTVVGDALRDALTAAGYLPLIVTVPRKADGTYDYSLLELMLRQQMDVVVQLHDQPEISRWLSDKKISFVRFTQLGGGSYRGCLCTVLRRMDAAVADFVADCRRKGVSRVLQVSMDSKRAVDVCKAFRGTGISVDEWKVVTRVGRHIPGPAVTRGTIDAFAARFAAEGRRWLPDVMFFQDDYLATGALMALQAEAIRIPEDVAVVTWANIDCGCGPVFVKPMTRMETDAQADGRCLADMVIEGLRTGRYSSGVVSPKYVRGETF